MSNKVEAALGGAANTFTDEDGEVFEAVAQTFGEDYPSMVELLSHRGQTISFYKEDAAKIIALIAEAAK